MNQGLRSFLAIGVDSEKLFLESLDARPEEGLDLVVQIEKLHAQKLCHSPSDRRLADATHACHKNSHRCSSRVHSLLSELLGEPFRPCHCWRPVPYKFDIH
jgi:hypothetical protein